MEKEISKSSVLGIIPDEIDVHIGLNQTLEKKFSSYIETLLNILKKEGVKVFQNSSIFSLNTIIEDLSNPRS